jgi:hypothetical protein
MRWVVGGSGLLVMLFGLACLNYTKGFEIGHHVQWANEQGLPQPGEWIFAMGALLAVLGAGAVGFTIAEVRRKGQAGAP